MKTLKQILSLMLVLCLTLSCAACQKGDADDEDPGDWQEQYDLGVRYLSEGNYEEAVLAFEAAIDIDPKQADAYLRLAEAYVALGDTDKAARVLRQGLRRVEDDDGLDALEEMQEKLASGDLSGFPGQSDTPDDSNNPDTPDTPDAPDTPEEPETPEEPKPDPEVLRPVYMGDAGASDMTPNEAAALAQVLRQAIQDEQAAYDENIRQYGTGAANWGTDGIVCYAKLFDAGQGRPALLFAGAAHMTSEYTPEGYMIAPYQFRLWHFPDGELRELADLDMLAVHDGWVLLNGLWPDGGSYDGAALALVGYVDEANPLGVAKGEDMYDRSQGTYEIDGRTVTPDEFQAWMDRWDGDSDLGVSHGSDIGADCWGMDPAEAVLEALDAWANPGGEAPEAPNPPAAPAGGPLAYEMTRLDYPNDAGADIYIDYPVFQGDTEGIRKINECLKNEAVEFIEGTMVGDTVAAARTTSGCFMLGSVSVGRNDGRILCLTGFGQAYTGGARPIDWGWTHTFVVETGEEAYLDDVLGVSPEQALQMVYDALIAEYGANTLFIGDSLSGPVEDIDFDLRDDGIRVSFPPDTIAPHAMGYVEVTLPYPQS